MLFYGKLIFYVNYMIYKNIKSLSVFLINHYSDKLKY